MADKYPMASEQPRPRFDRLERDRAGDIAAAAQGMDTFKGDLVADEQHEMLKRAMALKMMKDKQMESMNLPLTAEQAASMPSMDLPLTAEQGQAKRNAAMKKYASLK